MSHLSLPCHADWFHSRRKELKSLSVNIPACAEEMLHRNSPGAGSFLILPAQGVSLGKIHTALQKGPKSGKGRQTERGFSPSQTNTIACSKLTTERECVFIWQVTARYHQSFPCFWLKLKEAKKTRSSLFLFLLRFFLLILNKESRTKTQKC